MIGTGCMLITREVAQTLVNKYAYPFNLIETPDALISEDYSFCMRAREAGFKIWIDPRLTLVHLGTYGYGMSDFYNFVEFNKGAQNAG
jgi:GT2 family glycosyltransferase